MSVRIVPGVRKCINRKVDNSDPNTERNTNKHPLRFFYFHWLTFVIVTVHFLWWHLPGYGGWSGEKDCAYWLKWWQIKPVPKLWKPRSLGNSWQSGMGLWGDLTYIGRRTTVLCLKGNRKILCLFSVVADLLHSYICILAQLIELETAPATHTAFAHQISAQL